ncbi:DNA replication/repair protein RecF [Algihabitans albus]|uniref:DNA replication/repair protein RecF n=1 Tax=Algihabitans albus TaxID=2164067 RepID=UPI001F1CA206|nr:DNA replication/repair protein RecF [Algihabitans albus]
MSLGAAPSLALHTATCMREDVTATLPVDATAGPSRTLWLSRLSLSGFRNFRDIELALEPGPLLLTGPNGAGKTNLLEAVSLLSPGRGLRAARLADLDRRGASNFGPHSGSTGWAVAATVQTPEGPRDVGTGRDPRVKPVQGGDGGRLQGGRERRTVKLDGAFVTSQQALGEVVRCVWLTPQMDRLFEEGPSARRRFLDRLVYGFDPAHSGRIAAYETALRERSRILKDGLRDPAWLTALEATLAEKAVAIAAARRETVARLASALSEADGPFPRADLGLAGDAEAWLDDLAAVEVEERLAARLAADRTQDAETGGARVGAHRTDLAVAHGRSGMPAAHCSSGEQKALLISVVLAHARLVRLAAGCGPLLLLDEVAAHLDAAHRSALFERLLELGLQAWITGSEPEPFEGLLPHAQQVTLHDGLALPDRQAFR